MRTRNIVIIVIIVILVVLGLWWASAAGAPGTGNTASSTSDMMATTTASTTDSSSSTNGSASGSASTGSSATTLRTIASQTNNFTCTVTAGGSSGQATGVIYGAGGKIRVDITIPSNNGSITSHVIRSNGYAYSWVDGKSTGTKTAISTSATIVAPGQGGVISLDSATASECHPWSPDTTQFTPPAGITFS